MSDKYAYFPVRPSEQDILVRIRRADLSGQLPDLLANIDIVAESGLSPAELELAVSVYRDSMRDEGLEAKFSNLEARLFQRLEKGLAEIEGRLHKQSADPAPSQGTLVTPIVSQVAASQDVPPEANLALRVNQHLIWGDSGRAFYIAFWSWLLSNGVVADSEIPMVSGKSRYLIAHEPTHQTGKPFYDPRQVGAYFLETNLSRKGIISICTRILTSREIDHDVVVGP